jgi:hypothetical protein
MDLSLKALVILFSGAAVVAACGNADSSTFATQNTDAGPDNSIPPGSLGSSDSGIDVAADASCSPVDPTAYTATWSPPKVVAGACTDQEIADAYDACFAPPVDATKCSTYKTAHASCAACVSSDQADATHGPLIWQKGGLYFTLNVAGCLAIELKDVAAGSCGAAFDAAIDCKRTACDSCVSGANLNFGSLSSCETSAGKSGVCKTLGQTEGTKCGDLQTPDAATNTCFEAAGENLRTIYLRVAPLFFK